MKVIELRKRERDGGDGEEWDGVRGERACRRGRQIKDLLVLISTTISL